ncbi:hypothetical protein [Streptomyces sp. NPDC020917]|uniref:hypothetical protein n=1 Tax=Streptomyces sp. NPDC020917 TaxID=3365102 RepID=UPI0037B718DC
MTSHPDGERLQHLFTDAAHDITPSPVPLAAIEREGRSRRRRHAAVLATACGLLLIPLTATAVHVATPSSPQTVAQPGVPASSVRVVAPGERVQAAPGVRLWLTGDGKHWSTPDEADQFRSVSDGNLDMSRPGITLQSEPVPGRYFLSGVYYGDVAGRAATVAVTTDRGIVTGRLVHLPGTPGWGAWYASAPLPTAKDVGLGSIHRVTVRDAGGDTLATLNLP